VLCRVSLIRPVAHEGSMYTNGTEDSEPQFQPREFSAMTGGLM
jgi:hypothetical protein